LRGRSTIDRVDRVDDGLCVVPLAPQVNAKVQATIPA
jgi:hypothetical protein